MTKHYRNEKEFEKEVRSWLDSRPHILVLPKIVSCNEHGIPDILFSVNGQFYAWELKIKKKISKPQFQWMVKATSKGCQCLILTPENFETQCRLINSFLRT